MAQPQQPKPNRRPMQARPGQDIVTAKQQASQFPNVGMTLRSYQYDSRDRNRRRPGQPTVVRQSWWRRTFSRGRLKRAFITVVVMVLLVGGWVGLKFAINAHKLFGGSLFGILSSTKLKGEDQGRVNILLAGNSADDPGHNGANLTDSIMIISLDTRNHKAFLMSIPRDLWVRVPGNGHEKINAAYSDGQSEHFNQSGLPSGGMGLLTKVVESNFNIDINYYALVDYSALRDAVNAVGGVDIVVKSEDPRGLYDPNLDYATHPPRALVKLSNGPHHLDGEQALDLARARGDAYNSYGFPQSDFDRTAHQRQLIVALKTKATSVSTLANPAKLSSLSDAIGNHVKTDFSLGEVHRLYDLSKQINSNNVKSLSLNDADGQDLLASYSAPDGSSALIPAAGLDDFSDIQAFLRKQTSSNPVVQEDATVVVLNATDDSGLASRQRTYLKTKNFHITDVGDATANQAATTIIDNTGGKKPATRQALMNIYGQNVTTANPYAKLYDADFIVLLGNDQAKKDQAARAASD